MKIILITSRVPYTLEKGDKLRIYHHLKELSKNNEIHLFAFDFEKKGDKNLESLQKICKTITIIKHSNIKKYFNVIIAFFKGLPLQVGFFYSNKTKKLFLKKISEIQPDHIYTHLIRTSEYVKNVNISKTLDLADAISLNLQRSSKKVSFFKKIIYEIEAKRAKKYENYIFDKFDNKLLVSESDRKFIPHENRNEIFIIPMGVNFNQFQPKISVKDIDILFSGNMKYFPNIDGALFLIEEILPLLLLKKKDIKIMIAGTNPPNKIMKYASNNIIVTGWVKDIAECYNRAKISVAPMRVGTGLQNKILEAMAMKLPCITTELSNRSLNAENNQEIIIANDKNEIADAVLNLLNNNELYEKIANNAYAFVRKNFIWEEIGKYLNEIIQNTKKK
ncbi:MAG: glycosyltransferase [Bacteroidales bacterium]|jgi:glycosyltransferase involved in cell wall biosynthesis|nr:glycosyltransferase [Bacteroidales bacterium]